MFELVETPFNSINDILDDSLKFIKSNKKIEYLNVASSFDIETTSFYNQQEKQACMYAWVFGLNDKIIVGRTWEEFKHVLDTLYNYYGLNDEHRLIIYVHNLSFEFQFFRKIFKWKKIFSLSEREVVYALTEYGIEFRCSYILTGYSLSKLSEQCVKYPIKKMVGDLDYSLKRHSKTPLTDTEWKYIYNDGLVILSYIQQCIENEGNNITNIPLTKTGYVRRYCRNECLYEKGSHSKNTSKYLNYRKITKALTINSLEEYEQLKRAFIGGHSHGNPLGVGEVFNDVTSFDFTSSYPYCILSELYPMSKSVKVKIKSINQFNELINKYCCIFDVTFYEIESITPYEHFIPSSKCYVKEGCEQDNGKIIKAEKICMSLTEVDFKTYSKFYKWRSFGIKNFRRYMKGYLPKNFILSILSLYKKKTELKGIDEKYIEYMQSKADLNSAYGMMVTDICRDEVVYENNEWNIKEPDYIEMLNKYNNSKNRFLFYVWGVYVTAYAKKNLADGILNLNYDYLYSDTDSVKFINYEKHKDYFESYNKNVKKKLLKMTKHYNIDISSVEPKNEKNESKLIGIWDYDSHYKKFKYLGSKRYMVQYDNNEYSFTVAGCNKRLAIPYMKYLSIKENKDIFDLFDDNLYITNNWNITLKELDELKIEYPKELLKENKEKQLNLNATSKNIHTYIDFEQDGFITDYLGITEEYHELSSVHLESCDFTLSLSVNFANYILGLRGVL